MTENPYEPPQTEMAPAAVEPLLEFEEPAPRPIFRVLLVGFGLLMISSVPDRAFAVVHSEWSLESWRQLCSALVSVLMGTVCLYIGITGKTPSILKR
ncbi:hypothetical protein [Aeoliella sp. SH292]|uniref:hypothetical protein n=1 Tax=Aeoliella sp. SH292 TaxID=3454464 RepID=UPI003F9A1F51